MFRLCRACAFLDDCRDIVEHECTSLSFGIASRAVGGIATNQFRLWAALPVACGGPAIGAIGLGWADVQTFGAPRRQVALDLAADALDLGHLGALSSLLYDTSANPGAPPPPEPWFAEPAPGADFVLLDHLELGS